ncbi:hypothetical protein GM182_00235 [bacterium 3DAC]|nr:hypothetical protein GM182_00235 [bacterium 3DAC]
MKILTQRQLKIYEIQYLTLASIILTNTGVLLISNRFYKISYMNFFFILYIWSIINIAISFYISLTIGLYIKEKRENDLTKIYPYLFVLTLLTFGTITSLYGNTHLTPVLNNTPYILLPQFPLIWLSVSISIIPIVSILLNLTHQLNIKAQTIIIFTTTLPILYAYKLFNIPKMTKILLIISYLLFTFLTISIDKKYNYIYKIYENSTLIISLFIGLGITELMFFFFHTNKIQFSISPWFTTLTLSITILLFTVIARISPIGKLSTTAPLVMPLDKLFIIILLWTFCLIMINYPVTGQNLLTGLITLIGGSLIFYIFKEQHINTYFFEFFFIIAFFILITSLLYLIPPLFSNVSTQANQQIYPEEKNRYESYMQFLFSIDVKYKTNNQTKNIKLDFFNNNNKDILLIKSPIKVNLSGGIYNLAIYPPPITLNVTGIKNCIPLSRSSYQINAINGQTTTIYLKDKNQNNNLYALKFQYSNTFTNITHVELHKLRIPIPNTETLLYSQRNILLINKSRNTIYNFYLNPITPTNSISTITAVTLPEKQKIIFNNESYFFTTQGLFCFNQDILSLNSNSDHKIICIDFQKPPKDFENLENEIITKGQFLKSLLEDNTTQTATIRLEEKIYRLERKIAKDCQDDNTHDYCRVYPFKPFENLFIAKEINTSSKTSNN